MTDNKTGVVDKKKNKVDEVTAIDEFDRWAEDWGIEIDEKMLGDEDKKEFVGLRDKVVKAIMRGHATVSEDLDLVYTLQRHKGALKELKFSMPNMATMKAMDKHKGERHQSKSAAFIAHSTGQPEALVSEIRGPDVKFAQAVALLFLGS